MTQNQFANLVGVSRSTIQQIELLKLPLSEPLAHRISEQTDVAIYWLRENRLDEPILTRRAQPWNLECFQLAQEGIWRGGYRVKKLPMMRLFRTYNQLRWIAGDRDWFELIENNFLLNLQKEFATLWETISDDKERQETYRAYRDEKLTDEELLRRVIDDARNCLAAIQDSKKSRRRKPKK